MDNLIYNIKKITEEFLMFGVKSIFISGLVYTTRVDVLYLKEAMFWSLISAGKIVSFI